MKQVRLVKLKHEDIEVHDGEDRILLPVDSRVNHVIGSQDYVPERFYQEYVDVHKIIDHGMAHYIAVNNKVWEYLYYIENPVTAKTQQNKINALTESSESWEKEAWKIGASFKTFKRSVFNASLITRIKWIFTGVKF